ncbi:MAG TPA: MFS transporter [Stellaceae bacterium]|nr:MFS transporter [Stellaceae bacterium]
MNLAEDGLPKPQRYWAILTLMVGLAMSCLDTAIVNVALPAIARDLHTSAADSIWVVNAYQLAVMISLLPLASLGDIFGYRRVYRAGLVVYTAAALISALGVSHQPVNSALGIDMPEPAVALRNYAEEVASWIRGEGPATHLPH